MFTVFADEHNVQAEDAGKDDRLDPAVVDFLARHFPGLEVAKMEEDRERGERVKEVQLADKENTKTVVVKLSESNEVLEVEEEFDHDKVPEHVVRALRKAFPKAEIQHAEKETRIEFTYQLDIEHHRTKHEAVISRRGRISEAASRD